MTNITLPRAELQQVLEAMENFGTDWDGWHRAYMALRERLAQPEQEPMLTVDALRVEFERPYKGRLGLTRLSHGNYLCPAIDKEWQQFVSKYTPPQRQPLSDEECDNLWAAQLFDITDRFSARDFIRDVEAAHGIKEKNT